MKLWIKKIRNIFGVHIKYFYLQLLMIFIVMLCGVMTPYIVQITMDYIITNTPYTEGFGSNFIEAIGGIEFLHTNLWVVSFIFIFIALINGYATYQKSRCGGYLSENIAKDMRYNLYNKIQSQPVGYYNDIQSGDIIQRCTTDVDTTKMFLSTQVSEFIKIIGTGMFIFLIMLSVNVTMALAAILLVPLYMILSAFFFIKSGRVYQTIEHKDGELNTVLQENITSSRVVRAFGRQEHEAEKFESKNGKMRALFKKFFLFEGLSWSIALIICMLQFIIVIITGIVLANRQELTVGEFMMFIMYTEMLVWPLRDISRILTESSKVKIAITRIEELLHLPVESDNATQEVDSIGDIEFKNLTFSYIDNETVLEDLCFTIKQGEVVGILGATGCGKTTIAQLLLRNYDYEQGSIKINGKELKDVKKANVRDKISIVLQQTHLYTRNIRENLEMSKSNVTQDEIANATKTACIYDNIVDFKEGFETIVGEKGVTLSGGQKQRVAIARALIKNAEVIIFDDSLSAVDTQTEESIKKALTKNQKGKTTIIIASRISTIKDADKIIVLENKKVDKIGTHDELIKTECLYKRIWELQQ